MTTLPIENPTKQEHGFEVIKMNLLNLQVCSSLQQDEIEARVNRFFHRERKTVGGLRLKAIVPQSNVRMEEQNIISLLVRGMTTKEAIQKVYSGKIHADEEVLETAPWAEKPQELELFRVGEFISDDDLADEYEKRGLAPADLHSLAAWSEADKKVRFIATHWKDAEWKWCRAAFEKWANGRTVDISWNANWGEFWEFAGIRKFPKPQNSDLEARVVELERVVEKIESFFRELKV